MLSNPDFMIHCSTPQSLYIHTSRKNTHTYKGKWLKSSEFTHVQNDT